ncbi:hypothetical protein JCM21900_006224 [Sporobolomyces salmonicolor]
MCGRFALGLSADELEGTLAAQYFGHQGGQPQPDPPPQDALHGGGDGRSVAGSSSSPSTRGGAQQGGAASEAGEQGPSATAAGPEGRWASLEAKAAHRPRFNVAPQSRSVVLLRRHGPEGTPGRCELELLKWGLIPSWYTAPPSTPPSTINAQCESVFEGKPTWRGPRENKRCVVVAQGFYEWLQKGKGKVPHFVKRADAKLMTFAGLYDHCDYKGHHEPVSSYTIITTPACPRLRFLHSRMPAILDSPEEVQLWLSGAGFTNKVKALIRPFEGGLEVYPVPAGVGKVGNDSKEFIEPVAQKKGSLDSMFAKQKATASPSSEPPTSTSAGSASRSSFEPNLKKRGVSPAEEDMEAMNPDEDTPEKVEAIAEAIDGKGKGKGKGVGVGVRREVEVLDLSQGDDVDQEEDDEKPPKKKGKMSARVKEEKGEGGRASGKRKGGEKEKQKETKKKKKTDGDGNGQMEDFFERA